MPRQGAPPAQWAWTDGGLEELAQLCVDSHHTRRDFRNMFPDDFGDTVRCPLDDMSFTACPACLRLFFSKPSQEGFRSLAEEIIVSRPEEIRPRLVEAFQALYACHSTSGTGSDRAGRRRFQEGMREFVTSIRSFFPAEQAAGYQSKVA